MASVSFPGPGQDDDGEQPLLPPAGPARDEPGPGGDADRAPGGADDWDADADMARFMADVDEGRIPVPPEDTVAPPVLFTLGEAADVDPVVLAGMAGPNGLGGQCFASDAAADVMRPGPLLAALTENAAADPRVLSDDELTGMVAAARRLQSRGEFLELSGIAEFTRRRAAQLEAAKAAKVPRGCRTGEFPDEELAYELVTSARAAGDRMDFATALATRLPQTFAGMAAGRIDAGRAGAIWWHTRFLSGADAAYADEILAAAAPGLRHDQLARKAAGLEMKLDREGVKQRKEDARKEGQRVEARREPSGNMSYGGRELAAADVLAAKAVIDADAVALRNGGVEGSLARLRVLAFQDRLQGRDPLDRLTGRDPRDPAPGGDSGPAPGADGGHAAGAPGGPPSADPAAPPGAQPPAPDDEDEGRPGGFGGGPGFGSGGPGAFRGPAPLPALITLVVPAGTLLGWSGAPALAGGWGLPDGDDTRDLVAAASRHPRTRWCLTITGPDGTAIAHGCARGQHPWAPAPGPAPGDGNPGHSDPSHSGRTNSEPGRHLPPRTCGTRDGPDAEQAAQLAALLRALSVTPAPIAKGGCDHRSREDRYTPSRALKHLVRARTTRCSAPGCDAQAQFCDLDHTVPYPDGMTCQCDLSPGCRRHHRAKQAPGWKLEQTEPGVLRWTVPSGRTYTTTPTVYDA